MEPRFWIVLSRGLFESSGPLGPVIRRLVANWSATSGRSYPCEWTIQRRRLRVLRVISRTNGRPLIAPVIAHSQRYFGRTAIVDLRGSFSYNDLLNASSCVVTAAASSSKAAFLLGLASRNSFTTSSLFDVNFSGLPSHAALNASLWYPLTSSLKCRRAFSRTSGFLSGS
jgi:hypothetical protein